MAGTRLLIARLALSAAWIAVATIALAFRNDVILAFVIACTGMLTVASLSVELYAHSEKLRAALLGAMLASLPGGDARHLRLVRDEEAAQDGRSGTPPPSPAPPGSAHRSSG